MGIDIGARVVVGLPAGEIDVDEETLEEHYDGSLGEWAYENGLNRTSPYFDADDEDCLIGVVLADVDYTYTEMGDLQDLVAEVEAAQKKFKEVTGKEGKLYVSPNVW